MLGGNYAGEVMIAPTPFAATTSRSCIGRVSDAPREASINIPLGWANTGGDWPWSVPGRSSDRTRQLRQELRLPLLHLPPQHVLNTSTSYLYHTSVRLAERYKGGGQRSPSRRVSGLRRRRDWYLVYVAITRRYRDMQYLQHEEVHGRQQRRLTPGSLALCSTETSVSIGREGRGGEAGWGTMVGRGAGPTGGRPRIHTPFPSMMLALYEGTDIELGSSWPSRAAFGDAFYAP